MDRSFVLTQLECVVSLELEEFVVGAGVGL